MLSVSAVEICLIVLCLSSGVFLLLSLRSVFTFKEKSADHPTQFHPSVSILKPLCGNEPRLYECLRSFMEQDYQDYQLIFGVREASDTAIAVVERLRGEFPDRDISLICDSRIHGANLKISNVMNMAPLCRHPYIMVSDSDVEVGADFLSRVMADMEKQDIGLLSCIYKGYSTKGLVSELGALYINQWIIPSILVDRMLSGHETSLGPALVVRQDALAAAGGFIGIANHLAEDCELGLRIEAAGWAVRLSHYTIDTMVNEERLADLIRHEVRWAHTIRAVRPMDHFLSVITCALPIMLILFALHPSVLAGIILSGSLLLRLGLSAALQSRFKFRSPIRWWLVWPRECLCFAVWAISMFSRAVIWRGQSFSLLAGGLLVPVDTSNGKPVSDRDSKK